MRVLRYEPWWRMPSTAKPVRMRRRVSGPTLWFVGYWSVALAAAYALQADWIPLKRWVSGEPAAMAAAAPAPAPVRTGRTAGALLPGWRGAEERGGERVRERVEERGEERVEERGQERVEERERGRAEERERERAEARERERAEARERERAEAGERERERVDQPEEEAPAKRRRAPVAARAERAAPKREEAPRSTGRAVASSGGGQSCEAAIASYRESVRIGDRSTPPDLTQASYAAVLDNGSYFSHCGVPESVSIRICAAVQNGRAVGVTVRTDPPSAKHQRCVARAVRGLSFPKHPRMDVTTTVFE